MPGNPSQLRYDPKNKATIFAFLEQLNLKQEAPRARTILCCNSYGSSEKRPHTLRLSFPWVSIGFRDGLVYVFFHDKPWATAEEAYDLLWLVPDGFHLYSGWGAVCVGDAIDNVQIGAISPSEAYTGIVSPSQAFWHTANESTVDMMVQAVPIPMMTPPLGPDFCKVNLNQPGWRVPGCTTEFVYR